MNDAHGAGRGNGESLAVASGAAALAIAVGAALVPLRSTLAPTNVALILTALVVVAAIAGGRVAGVATAVTAALSFNFFHTKPYLTMRVADTHDVTTIVLIALIGFGVGELTRVRVRRNAEVRDHAVALHGLEAVAAVATAGGDPRAVLAAIRRELVDGAGLADARFEVPGARVAGTGDSATSVEPRGATVAVAADRRPMLDRNGHVDASRHAHTGRGFALPSEGVRVLVAGPTARGSAAAAGAARDETFGHLVIEAAPGATVSVEQRRAIVAMVDQLAMAISQHPEVSLAELGAEHAAAGIPDGREDRSNLY